VKELLPKATYESEIAASRDRRMAWWRDGRLGLFIHYGVFSVPGRGEWIQACEGISVEEYEKLADLFLPKVGCAREWVKLAKETGCTYAVLTTRHHEGFSLWDSRVNPFNSINFGPHRDIVREFTDACREYGLKIGLYSSLMDWHHPDGWRCAFDREARRRFLDYIEALNTELLTNYGKIDILWHDGNAPMETAEGWDSLARNQRLRALQPDIIINDRSGLVEDFGTLEGAINGTDRDWEACMTFNDLSWGYVDDAQTKPYAYSCQQILKMINKCCYSGGNLLINIGPRPDGSVPEDAIRPLCQVGKWMQRNGAAAYGQKAILPDPYWVYICKFSAESDRKTYYLWFFVWPTGGEFGVGGFRQPPKRISLLKDGSSIPFTYDGYRIQMTQLPRNCPDESGLAVLKFEFAAPPDYIPSSRYPQLNGGVYYPPSDNRL